MTTLEESQPLPSPSDAGQPPAASPPLTLEPSITVSVVRRFIGQMPASVQNSFTSEQLQEISKALTRRHSRGPFVNLHLSLFRFFITIYAGREKRSRQRLKIDRLKQRVATPGNLLVAGALAIGTVCTALTAWRLITLGTL